MIILAIETSCDETAISVLKADKNKFEILSNIVASQVKIHAKWGGVVPNLAKREHQRNLPIVLKKALKKAGFVNLKSQISNLKDIDLIAVTTGPGLEPCLWTGINFAQELYKNLKSQNSNLKIIGINHMEGHILSVLLKEKSNLKSQISKIEFPAMALLVSGGHTELVLIKDWLKYKVIGATRDDAAGEAFDKVAKMLGLPYPGGPEIAKLAARTDLAETARSVLKLPRPMINSKDYDFSFSGLKTAVLYLLKDLKQKGLTTDDWLLKTNICREFQQAVIDVLIKKTLRAAKEFKVKTIILGGGVAANNELRTQLGEKIKKELPITNYLLPITKYTTDNAAMIAAAAYFHAITCPPSLRSGAGRREKDKTKNLKADGNLSL
ncbi:MAG: tRNA (adenosine(37)-N6)-threonylcarbamoyltransferase complex transferase subunit TsaD [Candidatus Berkelbacteria bacterium]|nr:tRNA (adenosine(37)-N6)-threonylcarbamoyltransferase complex transferase subunit TsaD [Candidatus Berkelbacteria bacterium]